MTLEEVQELWSDDSKIHKDDMERMDADTLSGGKLLSKYMNILGVEKRRAYKLEVKKNQLQLQLEGYYKDGLYLEELQRRPSVKIAKTNDEAKRLASVDKTMIQLKEMIVESDEIITFCLEVVQYIRYSRTKDITNFIAWTKFRSGAL